MKCSKCKRKINPLDDLARDTCGACRAKDKVGEILSAHRFTGALDIDLIVDLCLAVLADAREEEGDLTLEELLRLLELHINAEYPLDI